MEGMVILGFLVAANVLWVAAVVDAARQPSTAWLKTGRSKVAWVIGLLLIHLVAALYYWLVVRRQLVAAARRLPPAPKEAPVTVPKGKEEWGDPWS